MESRLSRSVPILAVVGVVVCALALHLHTAFGAESPETAVRQLVESRGATYAGDCGGTERTSEGCGVWWARRDLNPQALAGNGF